MSVDRPIRILHAACALVDGGAETQMKLLLTYANRERFKQGVYFLRDDPSFTDRSHLSCYQIDRGSKLNLIPLYRQITGVIDDFKPDLIQLWLPEIMTWPASIYAKIKGIPTLSSQRLSLRGAVNWKTSLRESLIALPHFLSRKVVTNFPFENEPPWLRKQIENRQGQCVPNALLPMKERSETTDIDGWDDQACNILFVGRISPQKRLDVLLKATGRLIREGLNAYVYVCGVGKGTTYEKEMEALAESELEGRCHFLGYRADWRSIAHHFTLFAFPTVAEGMPNVLLEAMSAGLPSVATDIPEIREITRHQQEALLVEPDNTDAFATALGEIARNKELRARLSAAAMERSGDFSIESMVSAYERIYVDLIVPEGSATV